MKTQTSPETRKFRICKLLLVSVLWSGSLLATENVSVILTSSVSSVHFDDAIPLSIVVRNDGDSAIRVLDPSVRLGTLRFLQVLNGKDIPFSHRDTVGRAKEITIEHGQSLSVIHDFLEEQYPGVLGPGVYKIKCKYNASWTNSITSNEITIEVQAFPPAEAEAAAAFNEVSQAGE